MAIFRRCASSFRFCTFMKATLIQMDIAWNDASFNRLMAERLMRNAPGSDLYVLPEMFTTGFAVEPEGVAEKAEGDTLQWMRRMAATLDGAVAGSVSVKTEDGQYRNRLYFVKPDGTFRYYDKRHLFAYGGESEAYTAGEERVVVEWRGVRFLLQVCYDLRFPVFSRNGVLHDCPAEEVRPLYDCAIYVANWPDSRRRVWDILTRARALENQCYVLAVNRIGCDPQCHYDGGTALVDAYGKTIAAAEDNTSVAITAEMDMERLANFRKKFPVLADGERCWFEIGRETPME